MTDIITKLLKTMIVFAAYLYVNTTAYAVQVTNNNPWPPASFVDNTNTRLPIELKPMSSSSYKVAAIHFLGTESDLSFSKKDVIDDNNVNDGAKRCAGYSVIGTDCRAKGSAWVPTGRCPHHSNYYQSCLDCTAYTLSTKPENAAASQCGNGMWKIDSCNTGYKLEGSSCLYGCSDYPLTSKPANASTVALCEYDSTKMKLTGCDTGYDINGNTCLCIPKTPDGYQGFNNCEFGLEGTTTDHCGKTYYKCKAVSTCAGYIAANLKQYVPISSTESLQHALLDNLDNFVVVNDFTLTEEVNLSGKTIFGANDITATTLCSNMATPAITVNKSILTDNSSNFRKLHFKNYAEDIDYKNPTAMILGGGSFSDIEFSVPDCGKTYCNGNYYKYHIAAKDKKVVNLYNVKSSGKSNFTVENRSTLNIKGKVEIAEGAAISMAGQEPTFNLESSGSLIITGYSVVKGEGIGQGDPTQPEKSSLAYNAYINIDGNLSLSDTTGDSFVIHDAVLKINKETKIGRIYGYPLKEHKAEVYINAKTTLDSNNYYTAIDLDGGSIYVNAPLYITNVRQFVSSDYTSERLFEAGKISINSDLVLDNPGNFVYSVYIRLIEFGAKANIRGLGRLFIKFDNYSSNTATIIISSGAKMQIGGVCKKATSNSQVSVYRSTIDWRTPPSQFSGGC